MQSDATGFPQDGSEMDSQTPNTEMNLQQAVEGSGEYGKPWYVLRVIGSRERKVYQHLSVEVERLKMQAWVENVLVPLEKVYQTRNGKKVSKERVIYPGYVFVQAYLDDKSIDFLLNTPDVLGFLSNSRRGGKPTPLRDHEVKRMLGKIDQLSEDLEMPLIPFKEGDVVKVIDGPFNTFSGVISEVNEEKKRLIVIVKIFERKTPLELNYMQVEKE